MKLSDLTRQLDRIERGLGRKRCKLCGRRYIRGFAELAALAEDGSEDEDSVLCDCAACSCIGSTLVRLACTAA